MRGPDKASRRLAVKRGLPVARGGGICALVASIFLSGVGVMRPMLACQCGSRPTAAEATAAAETVFTGVVTDIREEPARLFAGRPPLTIQKISFRAGRVWKGAVPRATVLFTGFGNCDYRFERGHSYLVYGQKSYARGKLTATICLPTKPYRLAAADLRELGEGQPARP